MNLRRKLAVCRIMRRQSELETGEAADRLLPSGPGNRLPIASRQVAQSITRDLMNGPACCVLKNPIVHRCRHLVSDV